MVVIAGVGVFSGCCTLVECMFGSKWGPVAAFLVGMTVTFMSGEKLE